MSVLSGTAAGPGRAGRSAGAASVPPVPGYGPSGLRSAYGLTAASASDGQGATVAVVDAYSDPAAAADLAVYRSHYKLPACLQASGCLRIVNQYGSAGPLPAANAGWARDESLAVDTVSAICPNCRILLVEATSNSLTDLGTAENAAVAAGARYVFNSWSGLEFIGQGAYDHYFNHPGTAIVFASGDSGYGSAYPVSLQYVTAVGGTTLRRGPGSRHWTETAWSRTSSGCSILEPKPSWQRADATAPNGCLNRTENDVAADADPATGVSVYDSYRTRGGWIKAGGTPAAAAIITAVYALAGPPAARSYPASYPYWHAGQLSDVSSGSDGSCEPNRGYLCTAGQGYDGPTGLGSPAGTAAFSAAGAQQVTLLDPGTQDLQAGTAISVRISGSDARPASTLAYTATGLPAGLVIRSAPHSADGLITGTLPGTARGYDIAVTARDTKTGRSGTAHFSIVGAASLTPSAPVTTPIALHSNSVPPATGACLDAGTGTHRAAVTVQPCNGTQPQLWTYLPAGAPGAAAELTIGGRCLDAGVQLAGCATGAGTRSWRLGYSGQLQNLASGACLGTANGHGNQLVLETCSSVAGSDRWTLFAAGLRSAVPRMCVAVLDNRAAGSPYVLETCRNARQQSFSFDIYSSIESGLNRCMVGGSSRRDGVAVRSGPCARGYAQEWLAGPGGELINEGSGLCLTDPGNSRVSGTRLLLEDCYGQLGQIWAIG